MLNKIIKLSLYNRVITLVLAGLILAAGCVALARTEVDIFPDLNAPTVVVMTEAPGLAPEEVEQLVTFPIETAVNGATGVRRVRSSSAPGFSVVSVEFDWDTEIYRARQIISEHLDGLESQLPPGVDAPVLGPQSSIMGEIMIIGLTSDSVSQERLRTLADRVIRPRLLALGGVSQVSVIGGDVREYQVLLSPDKMRRHGVSLDEALAAATDVNRNAAGGVLYEYGNEYIIKGTVNTADVAELAASVVRSDQNGVVTLADIATVTTGSKAPKIGTASVRTKPAVLLTVTKQPAVGTIELTERVDNELEQLRSALPAGVEVTTDLFRQSDFIANSISNLQESLLEGALMVIIVLFFFLMNLRTTLVSLVALPMSILVAVIILHLMGVSINTMSLGGIAIAIGSLVDDAIVDVENVYKRLRANRALPAAERRSTVSVVFEASKEVRMPIFNSSLIIVASFMPLFFLHGMEGRMLIPLGVSFIVALAASTVVALTLTPVLCSYLLGSDKALGALDKEPRLTAWLKKHYSRGLGWCLAHGKVVLVSTGVLFLVSLGLFFTLGRGFLPPFNEGSMTINLAALPGISLEESDRIGRLAEEILLEVPEVRTVARKTGRAELDEHSQGVNSSEMEVPYELKNRSRGAMVRDIRARLTEIPGIMVEIGQPISHRMDAMLSGTEAQIAVKIFGDDLNNLYAIGRRIREIAKEVPGMTDVNIEQQTERPQLDIVPRRGMLARYGITMSEFTRFVNVALAGEAVSQVYEEGLPYDVTVKFDDASRASRDRIASMMIDSNEGKIPLSYVADIRSASGPNTINRENVSRRLVVSANVDGRDLRGAVNELSRKVAEQVEMPEGYFVTYGGQFESEAAASRTLGLTSLLALLIIFMLLYGEFRDFRESMVILVNMPLAMIGGVLILVITGGELNIPAIIGFISLLGIATRNGMLLISRYNQLEAEGVALEKRVALGSADRLTPIIMTALTSALALIPLALRSQVPGNEIQSPLAVVILGGLLSSTTLNIFVVPVLYRIIAKRKNQVKK
ncbi:MAG: efflux RND transporter permease subunit [[Clostridium] fimetarium]|nr:efflux RND transporter permease subunit [Alistipes timonensis]MCM1406698.1 efflux RND transporter permease subunit [[Clostridium] fimetarium]